MSDIHESKDLRNIAIDFIGLTNVKLPFTFKSKRPYATVATVNAGVYLTPEKKGARLSWIVEALNNYFANKEFVIKDFASLVQNISDNLETKDVSVLAKFQVIMPIETPVSKKISYKEIDIEIKTNLKDNCVYSELKLGVYGAMCCPNSKAKSKYGAHSQRCYLTVNMIGDIGNIFVEDVAVLLDDAFSAPVYSVVKSVDEVLMTEQAYENPKFTEDLIRDSIILLKEKYNNVSFIVEAENFESIHSHNVLARGTYNNGGNIC